MTKTKKMIIMKINDEKEKKNNRALLYTQQYCLVKNGVPTHFWVFHTKIWRRLQVHKVRASRFFVVAVSNSQTHAILFHHDLGGPVVSGFKV